MADTSNPVREPRAAAQPALVPPVDVVENQGGITLYADLPGVPKERLNVHVEADALIIEAEMGIEMPKQMQATHIEVSLPRYRRVFTLSRDLDPERLSAELKHGVLKVHIQKAEHAKPKRIEINAG